MKLLKEKYKTYEGARKRAAFENGIAAFEFSRGFKAKLYHYTVNCEDNGEHAPWHETWRVARIAHHSNGG